MGTSTIPSQTKLCPTKLFYRRKHFKEKKLFILNESMNMFVIVLFFVLSIHTLSKKFQKYIKIGKTNQTPIKISGIKVCSLMTKKYPYENNSIF